MKHFSDLNPTEHLKLALAMSRLKEEALRYSHARAYEHSELAYAARHFSDVLDEIELKQYYRPVPIEGGTCFVTLPPQ